MTGILKQLSAKNIASVTTDNYEVEAAKILHLNDQIDRATQALNLVGEYDRKLANGWVPSTKFDRDTYQQSMESASALTYDFMQLDIGYSAEASEKTPGMLKRIWDWISAAVANLMKMIRNALGLRKTKFIKTAAEFDAILEGIGRISVAKPAPFDNHKRPADEYVITPAGGFVGVGTISTGLNACIAAAAGVAANIDKLVNFNAGSVTPVKNKVETGGMIKSKAGLKDKFDLMGEMKLKVDVSIVTVEGRSGQKRNTYSGNVLDVGVMKSVCNAGLKAIDDLKKNRESTLADLKKFDQKIEEIRKKNYGALGERHYDEQLRKLNKNRGGDFDKMEQDANVYNALTMMIQNHFKALSEIDMVGFIYLGAMRHFLKANLSQYKEHAE
jgi:hypothetical protein